MEQSAKVRFRYFLERFALYFLIGGLLNLYPVVAFIFLAIIPILIASISMAIVDAYSIEGLKAPKVFNPLRVVLIIAIPVVECLFYVIFGNIEQIGGYLIWNTVFSVLLLITFFMHFAQEMQNRRKYAYQRFFAYFFVGFVASLFPMPPFAIFGAPTIAIGSILMATTDALSLSPSQSTYLDITPTPVFTRHYWITLGTLLGIIVSVISIYLLTMNILHGK